MRLRQTRTAADCRALRASSQSAGCLQELQGSATTGLKTAARRAAARAALGFLNILTYSQCLLVDGSCSWACRIRLQAGADPHLGL